MQRVVFRGFRIVDCAGDFYGSLVVENGRIAGIVRGAENLPAAGLTIDGEGFPDGAALMPAFVDLHAHFRDPGFPEKETLESASLAAASGGFATVVCMANTNPVLDSPEKVFGLKARADALSIVDIYPAMSLTKNMEGRELSGIAGLSPAQAPLMLSEDGRDVADDGLFLAAMGEAKRLGVPVSCHCDHGGEEASAVGRAVALGKKAGCRIHVAHVSTGETAEIIRRAKKGGGFPPGFALSCEAAPHHIGATEEDAARMGGESHGRVNPPLACGADRMAMAAAVMDGTIDAIATDHAPHTHADKLAGAPGFVGLETAFAACLACLPGLELSRLSALMSSNPAGILGLRDRGRMAPGLRADLVVVDTKALRKVDPAKFRSRGRCTPFEGRELRGRILLTMNAGRVVFMEGENE